jgi:hypothetical protein
MISADGLNYSPIPIYSSISGAGSNAHVIRIQEDDEAKEGQNTKRRRFGDTESSNDVQFIEIYHLEEENPNSSSMKSIPLIFDLSPSSPSPPTVPPPRHTTSADESANSAKANSDVEEVTSLPHTTPPRPTGVGQANEAEIEILSGGSLLAPFGDDSPSHKINSEMFAILFDMGYPEDQINHVLKRCNSISAAVQLLNPDYHPASEVYRSRCPICFDDYPLSEMITLDCLHRLCLDCFKSYCESKINENEVLSDQLCCPIMTTIPSSSSSTGSKMCGHPITIHEIKANISEPLFQKYERFITRSFCENEKLTSCPKCNEWYVDLQEVLHLEHTWKAIQCQKCSHQFCGKCGQVPHKAQYDQDVDCETYAKWLESNAKTDDNFQEYIASNKLFSCPKCKMYGALESGCKFMYCRCKENFCALCGIKLKQSEHFSHFSGVTGATGPFGNVCLGMKGKAGEAAAAAAVVPPVAAPVRGKKAAKRSARRAPAPDPVAAAVPLPPPIPRARIRDASRAAHQVAPLPAVGHLDPLGEGRQEAMKEVSLVGAAGVLPLPIPMPPLPENYPNTRRRRGRGRGVQPVVDVDEEEEVGEIIAPPPRGRRKRGR